MLSPFQGEYKHISTLNMLIYSQPMSLNRVGEGDSNSICCGRLWGVVKAYEYKDELYVECLVHDDDDYELCEYTKVNNLNTQHKIFHEVVNILNDCRFYKIEWVSDFYSEFLYPMIKEIFREGVR